jgi:hypothetical protein
MKNNLCQISDTSNSPEVQIPQKTVFPPPMPIKEDFLPDTFNPMKNYRIKKVSDESGTRYYAQEKILWWWFNLFTKTIKGCLGDHYHDGRFYTLAECQRALRGYLREPVVEYIEFEG